MKIFKTIVWIAILFILESVFVNIIDIRGAVPDLLTVFAAAYAARERRLTTSAYVIIVCGVLTGSIVGRSFPISVLEAAFAGTAMFVLKDRIRFVPVWLKNAAVMLVTAAAAGFAEYFAACGFGDVFGALAGVLSYTAYTLAAALIIYPIVTRSVFYEKEGSKLLVI